MTAKESVDDLTMLMAPGIMRMSVVRVESLVRAGYPIEKLIACLRRTDVVLETDIDNHRTGD